MVPLLIEAVSKGLIERTNIWALQGVSFN